MKSPATLAKLLLLLSLTLLLSVAGLSLSPAKSMAASYKSLGTPKETVGTTKPPIRFYYTSDMTTPPDSYSMYIDETKVAAVYDKEEEAFLYTPTADLTPGTHTVRMSIVYSGYEPIDQSWTFTVASDAIKQFAAANAAQIVGLAAVNDYRTLFGLPKVVFNDKLNASASSHAAYLDLNKIKQGKDDSESMHAENPDKPGFTGKGPFDRAVYFGYTSGVGEDVAYSKDSIAGSVDSLFDAPYHRSPFLDPYLKEIGISQVGFYTVIEFGMDRQEEPKLVVSPAPGDRYAPTVFGGNEEPDPIRIHSGSEYPVGYPIMAEYYGLGMEQVKVLGADLMNNGTKKSVDFWINSPENDSSLDAAVLLIPRKPLEPDTSYHVMLTLQLTKGGQRVTEVKEWDFTTEPAAEIGKKKLHNNTDSYKRLSDSAAPVQRTVVFGLDASSYTLDGLNYPMKQKPVIEDGSSYLYVRDLAAALGASVEWDSGNQAAVYTKGTRKVTLYTTKNEVELNGETRTTDTPAKLIGDYTMVPVRLLSEVLGAKITYTEATRTVTIAY
ncbi:stalk domain-containing protein [Paenibacillus ginsengarvi]|uniref:S-layer protein n=1 Tax=Paenibacillus ginsengarvi TaxID=400777 RepID=A0A3B0C8Q6_9BACL|nr:stalk domain-containing protein [Paenibacillus ginsengarvi]RKN82243.1 S-layer protein [Paenibacillus ginsengarvi]